MKNVFCKRVLYYGKHFSLEDFVLWKTFSVREFYIMKNVFDKRFLYYEKRFL